MDLLKRSLVVAGLCCVLSIAFLPLGIAQVRVDVRIGPPPSYRIAAAPPMVVIPGTYVYVVPDIDADIFFCAGTWYRLYEGRWFSGRSYNGPWFYAPDPRVPRALIDLPPDWRRVPPGWRRIPYGQFKKNWAGWERDRYWDRDRDWHEGWHGRPEERHDEGRGHFEGRPEERRDEGRGPGEEHDRGFEHGDHGHER